MTSEEIIQALQAPEADRKALLEQLYTQNLPLIAKICRAYAPNTQDIQDLLQESYFALLEAVNRYDSGSSPIFLLL